MSYIHPQVQPIFLSGSQKTALLFIHGFTASPFDVVKEKDLIWVKVIGIMENRVRLSMKNINQKTGR